ncbi:hypothetical protein [Dysgonomonas sp. ZJ279]|uniref:hypothetical protein n=1 Tax=Dysgonomonas sp. ZJ279 TaxID=2709796 RepID=UPI0013EAC4C3|nr:hypothetical protein [Dysgonomonas sp. ZJ279]
MKHFTINYSRLIQQLLPIIFRTSSVTAFLEAFLSPIRYIYSLFQRNRDDNLYHLNITPQVCFIEKALNDRFDFGGRRIYISSGKYNRQLYIHTRSENKPVFIYKREENKPVYLRKRDEVGVERFNFIVNVPKGLQYNKAELEAIVEMYKLPTKTFIINEY